MRISRVRVRNFRLLANVELYLEGTTTVLVGRNNTGKTSLSEVVRRFVVEARPAFGIQDFSPRSLDAFCTALKAHRAGAPDDEVRGYIPAIELEVLITYDPSCDLSTLAEFVIDLDPDCHEALAVAHYELRPGEIPALFADIDDDIADRDPAAFLRTVGERIAKLYEVYVWAQDPNDTSNSRRLTQKALSDVLMTGCINAQRGLDDNTSRPAGVLSRILGQLYESASAETANQTDHDVAVRLAAAVEDIRGSIDEDFSSLLKQLMPTLHSFGYPGLGGQELEAETTLDVQRLLSDHTRLGYAGYGGIHLPESYNGLGTRNLIFILLQLVAFHRQYVSRSPRPGMHLIFIEEPEAHLHPQMQEVFIRQLSTLMQQLGQGDGTQGPWPVQFVVSTHSPHIANQAAFGAIRYFLANASDASAPRETRILDLREGLRDTPEQSLKFFHQYLTLTKCDLFFADKAVLLEGTSERLMLPAMIKKIEATDPGVPRLSEQYLTVVEIGGQDSQRFFPLLDFLELPCLVIADLDACTDAGRTCCVHEGTRTRNKCLQEWFCDFASSPCSLLAKKEAEKVKGRIRIAYQIPETDGGACGRTFEDAFMLANPELFELPGDTREALETKAQQLATTWQKTQFALKYALGAEEWVVPRYIVQGLTWLARSPGYEPGGSRSR